MMNNRQKSLFSYRAPTSGCSAKELVWGVVVRVLFCFFLCFGFVSRSMCDLSSLSRDGLGPLPWKHSVFTTGLPERSQELLFYYK